MKRLTIFDGEFWVHKNFPPVEEDQVDEFIDCVKELAARLAAIEDILGDEYDLDRLRELAQADREGRCVVLPVKPGTPVWSTAFCRVDEDGTEHPTPWPFGPWMVDGWGRDWFPTCEEAEAALRREQDG